MSFRRQLLTIRPLVWLASLRLTVTCLLLLFFLTLGGTIAQISDGLYLAQERYFESFVFLLFGFLPFPGAQLVMWVMFVNLITVALVRFTWQWDRLGIMITHGGLLLFLVSGFITLHLTQESQLTLTEGQTSNVSVAYHDWEIAFWLNDQQSGKGGLKRDIVAFDVGGKVSDQKVQLNALLLDVSIKAYDRNCRVVGKKNNRLEFESLDLFPEAEKNTPCAVLQIKSAPSAIQEVDLYGEFNGPQFVVINDQKVNMALRLKRFPLPFSLKLKDFRKEEHPGTATPRSFESLVEVIENGVGREKLIAMNEPLRYGQFTLYQASFIEAASDKGRQTSTFAVVENAGRWMPYISTGVTFMGMLIHFSMAAFRSKRKRYA